MSKLCIQLARLHYGGTPFEVARRAACKLPYIFLKEDVSARINRDQSNFACLIGLVGCIKAFSFDRPIAKSAHCFSFPYHPQSTHPSSKMSSKGVYFPHCSSQLQIADLCQLRPCRRHHYTPFSRFFHQVCTLFYSDIDYSSSIQPSTNTTQSSS